MEIDDRTSEVIAFVINAGMTFTANNFYIQIRKEVSLSELFALFN